MVVTHLSRLYQNISISEKIGSISNKNHEKELVNEILICKNKFCC